MAFVTKDRIKVTSTTTGTGTFTLGAASTGYQNFPGVGDGNQTYYTIVGGTQWEVGIGTYTASGTTLSRDTVLASSTGSVIDFAAGTKDVYVPQPAENTQGSAPTGDNNSIGTDGVAFDNFQKNLYQSINAGVTFRNNGVAGVVSTYSLVFTTDGGYKGGVLAPNGDIHLIPFYATRGQKIDSSGISSTYALIYSDAVNGASVGGVLASNGDIHFVPFGVRGQKISASGVVSTYSLVYTGTGLYWGGVLAPNGDIHFVPRLANRGQKVSAAGVVSTYSLVYTTTAQAYLGGVLAPNGDIHFVPFRANVGQKISAAGVVSTYSLVYTASSAYSGGVVAPNGDIHFVPNSANRGQKISIDGVVSTYSLVYTASQAYSGGVLAPNGDIHFVPYTANRGQKVSATGVVSTYSLVYTTGTGAYEGGVLTPDGSISFLPAMTIGPSHVQKISTNPAIPFGLDTCLSSYLNKF